MSATERLAAVPEQDRQTDEPKEERMTVHRPATSRRARRFEFGFFIRKIVNGWVVFYQQFPREHRAAMYSAVSGRPVAVQPPPVPPEQGVAAMAHAGTGGSDFGDVETQDSPGMGTGDPGPIGSTRYEMGFFVATTTETTGNDESVDDA